MSSKLQERFDDLLKRHKHVRGENDRLKRYLTAAIHHHGPLKIPYTAAAKVSDEDQINAEFDKFTGIYTVSLVEQESDDDVRLAGGSQQEGVLGREGDVGSPVREVQPERAGGDVLEGDKYGEVEDRFLQHSGEE